MVDKIKQLHSPVFVGMENVPKTRERPLLVRRESHSVRSFGRPASHIKFSGDAANIIFIDLAHPAVWNANIIWGSCSPRGVKRIYEHEIIAGQRGQKRP
mmetsp:Transcript_13759/g.19882  ORF Transcript_13759/g.19882 Transcript_13759/m.19882 type:complete len:99 (+) Transcript_13759:940-1236(+)